MTVSSHHAAASRAGSLALIASNLALDFANTESGRGFPSHQNHPREAGKVAASLTHASVLPRDEVRELRAETSARSDRGVDLLSAATDLRSAVQIGAAIARGSAPPEEAPTILATLYSRFLTRASLAPGDARRRWRRSLRASPVEASLGPIALAAVTLFTEGDFARIKECAGHACGWLFCDISKNNRRRWREMEICGNRAKQRRFATRRRGA